MHVALTALAHALVQSVRGIAPLRPPRSGTTSLPFNGSEPRPQSSRSRDRNQRTARPHGPYRPGPYRPGPPQVRASDRWQPCSSRVLAPPLAPPLAPLQSVPSHALRRQWPGTNSGSCSQTANGRVPRDAARPLVARSTGDWTPAIRVRSGPPAAAARAGVMPFPGPACPRPGSRSPARLPHRSRAVLSGPGPGALQPRPGARPSRPVRRPAGTMFSDGVPLDSDCPE
jgi:hypothetical protein